MQIPETPCAVEELDLMKQLHAYGQGTATWELQSRGLGQTTRAACSRLHSDILQLIHKVLAPLLNKVASREMETFTLHDCKHALKVAHLVWHILRQERRERLTPPEIGLLVLSAHMHDLGMGLSSEERQARLADPEFWERTEWDESTKTRLDGLRAEMADPRVGETARRLVERQLFQAEEALLCQDTRERHAKRERYQELLRCLREMHERDSGNIPDVDSCLAFDGQSFRDELIEVCVSHDEDTERLVVMDERNLAYPRFPRDYPVGDASADLLMVAAALRLADILDFDRERTPPALFLYLMPGPLAPEQNRSVLEWNKHLSIAHWSIEPNAIVFSGRCQNHIVHHAIVQFCVAISDEIEKTKLAFADQEWPFQLPVVVQPDIYAEGYKYVPYRFELDDERIYALLMGGAIYDNPLVAVRELVQNAVDACKLRDAMIALFDPSVKASTENRITVRYEEPGPGCQQPKVIVRDTGTGMDEILLRTYFLRVGQSYYRSQEFNKQRIELRKAGIDFAPVSEFGIGFLSCFLLADRVQVETAMSEDWRGDSRKRTLIADGPTRLIRMNEEPNTGPRRWKGTQVSLYLTRGGKTGTEPAKWEEIRRYLEGVCQELPYELHLEHQSAGQVAKRTIPPGIKRPQVPPEEAADSISIRIDDPMAGLEGELVMVDPREASRMRRKRAETTAAEVGTEDDQPPRSDLLRGGFRIGVVPGLPDDRFYARVRVCWEAQASRRYPSSNLARNAMTGAKQIKDRIVQYWLTYLLEHRSEIPNVLCHINAWSPSEGELAVWRYPWLEKYDAAAVYEFARKGWSADWEDWRGDVVAEWESGKGASLSTFRWVPTLHAQLLELVLPRITSLELNESSERLPKPPRPGWREDLRGWHDFVRNRRGWGTFAEFTGAIAGWLGTAGLLNEKYRAEISQVFCDEDIAILAQAIEKLVAARERAIVAKFTAGEAVVWQTLREQFPTLEIGRAHGPHVRPPWMSWPVRSFAVQGP